MNRAADKSIPVLRLPELRRPPTYSDLVNLVKTCDKNRDRYIVQPWYAGADQYSLRGFLIGSGEEFLRLKNEGKLIHPEFTLFSGNLDEQEIWVYSTRDVDLLLGLITAEVEGHARAVAVPMQTATLRDLPSRRAAAEGVASHISPGIDQMGAPLEQPGSQAPGMVLSGSIRGHELQNVIQSIGLCKMTGALLIRRELEQGAIFFKDGEIVDATLQTGFATINKAGDLRGDYAVLEILTWDSGVFNFDYSRRAHSASITKKTHVLLMEGIMLLDYFESLSKRQIIADTRFSILRPELTPPDVGIVLKGGLPLGMNWQLSVYSELRQGITLYELLKRKPMPKAIWVPIIYNLLSLKLIGLATELQTNQPKQPHDALDLDPNLVAKFAQDFVRHDTKMVSYAALSYLIDKEFQRFKLTRRQFSIVIFQIRVKRTPNLEPLSNEALQACVERFAPLLGPLDVLGHFQSLDFALLIPESGEFADADPLFERFKECICSPLLPGVENANQLEMKFYLYTSDQNMRLSLRARKSFN